MKEIKIDGIIYVPVGTNNKIELVKPKDNLPYKIVRTYSAGVFAGYVQKQKGKEVTLLNARRLWYWKGASSLSQLAMEGTKTPKECKFPCEVTKIELLEAIEILEVTKQAKESIDNVSIWQQ